MTELTRQEPGAVASRYDDQKMLDTLKQTVAKGSTDAEFKMFIEVCKSTGLNPFLKEIWCAVPMKDGQRSQYGAVLIMAGRDGYLRVANDHPAFDGIETRVERDEKTKTPIKAVCTVWRKDRTHPTICEAYYSEYYKPGYGGKPSIWDTYKSAMIGKVAEVLALKRSFSINGVVTEEEIGEQEPLGSREAQKAVATEKLAKLKGEPPPVHDAEFVEPQPEMAEPPAKISFKALESFKDIKTELKKLGAEARYYGVLKTFGVEKSNQLNEANARDAYKALAVELKALRLQVADREETDKAYASLVVTYGAEPVDALIGRQGHSEWADVPMAERDALLAKIKGEL